jgi:hypothetical protein
MVVTNTLAYNNSATISAVKSFITQVCNIKLFSAGINSVVQ